MIILSGVGFLAMTLLLFGWAYGAMRRPEPKPWANSETVATGVVLVLTALVAATLGAMAQAAFAYKTLLTETGPTELAAAAGVLIGAVVLSRLLMAPARRRTAQARGLPVASAFPLTAANDNADIGSRAA